MVNEFLGFTRSVIGSKKFPSDGTLKNMKKSDLIDLLHTAQHNFESLNWFYCNAVKYNERNISIPNWIPCSERLSEEDCVVLATIHYGEGEYDTEVGVVCYEGLCLNSPIDYYIFGNAGEEFSHSKESYEYLKESFGLDGYVDAWMPLPEPYRGEGGENG